MAELKKKHIFGVSWILLLILKLKNQIIYKNLYNYKKIILINYSLLKF